MTEDFIESLLCRDVICTSSTREDFTYSAHAIDPELYLRYAKEDIDQQAFRDTHRAINSISNSKKAIDCRIEDILCYWGISHPDNKNARIHFPGKVEILSKLGINTPLLINNINKQRNRVEHYFTEPSLKDARDFYELAELYIGYTSRYIPEVHETHEELFDLGEYNDVGEGVGQEPWYSLELNRLDASINVSLHLPGTHSDSRLEQISFLKDRNLFFKLVSSYYEVSVIR